MFNYIFSFNFLSLLLFIFKNNCLFLKMANKNYFHKNNFFGYFRLYRSRILYRIGLYSFYN